MEAPCPKLLRRLSRSVETRLSIRHRRSRDPFRVHFPITCICAPYDAEAEAGGVRSVWGRQDGQGASTSLQWSRQRVAVKHGGRTKASRRV